jgi:hypothetical protein
MRYLLPIALVLLSSCAHLGTGRSETRMRMDLWDRAHEAFYAEDFQRAEQLFEQLAVEYPETSEGRESLFYLGTLRLDPRNPAWSSGPAETRLQSYLAKDTAGTRPVHRRPEAETLLQLAMQLNLPIEDRFPGIQAQAPAPVVIEQRVVSAEQLRPLQEEVQRLRREVAQRDEQIRTQREELERIRRTLAPRREE